MDKLPTDNLYKFLALAGMALAIYCSYTSIQLFSQRESRLFDFIAKEDERTQKMVAADIPWAPAVWTTDAPTIPDENYETEDAAEREKWLNGVDSLIAYYTLNRTLPTKEIMAQYLARPSVKEAIIRHEGLPEARWEDYVEELNLDKFIAMTEPGRANAALHQGLLLQHKKEIEQLWDYMDLNRYQSGLYGGGVGWGAILAITGFILWYLKAQRFEDLILKQKAAEAMPEKRPHKSGLTIKSLIAKVKEIPLRHKVTHALSILTVLLAFGWVYFTLRQDDIQAHWAEPILTLVVLVTAYWSFVVEPGLKKRSDREELIEAIQIENATNRHALGFLSTVQSWDFTRKERLVYPRLMYAAIDRALTSGLFRYATDKEFLPKLLNTRIFSEKYNTDATLTEIFQCTADQSAQLGAHVAFLDGYAVTQVRAIQGELEEGVKRLSG